MRYEPSYESVQSDALRSQMRADAEERDGLKGEELIEWRRLKMIELDAEMRELRERNPF